MPHPAARTAALALGAALSLTPVVAAAQSRKAATVQSISARDRQEGAKAHPQLMNEFGGAYTGPQAAYVTRVGQTIAVQSGLSNARSDFTVTLLNSPVNNAFAVPGGYVYVTRQLMGLMNNEAELAGVLGHEVGHVAARHSQKRQSIAQRGTLATLAGVIGGGLLGRAGGVLGTLGETLQRVAPQLAQQYTLSFSRTQELEADKLGVQYLTRAGYDPMALSTMLASLANQTSLEARVAGKPARSLPEWASTHPDPARRVVNAQNLARQSGRTGGMTNRDAFLAALDGVLFDDDPKEGIVDGRTFTHPEMRLQFQVPNGFGLQNTSSAVRIAGNGGQGVFTLAPYNGDLDAYVRQAVQQVAGGQQGQGQAQAPQMQAIQRTTVNGMPAAYTSLTAQTQQGQVTLVVFAYEFARDRAYHFATLVPAGQANALTPMFQSVRRMSAQEAAAIRPRRLDVVTVRAGDTVQSLANRMAYDDYRLERFMVLNGLSANTRLTPGEKVKLVVSG